MEEFTRLLDAGCEELGIVLTEKQKEQFFKYFQLLTEWNQVMNLTAITEMPEVVTKHFLDSLLVVKVFDGIRTEAYSCIDVGTGAGFPGIPLKIAFPQLQIMLLDSLNKRVGFLNTVIQELGLTGVTAVHGRAEDFGRNKEYREQFDLCVSRAVANLSTLSEYCLPFVKAGGEFLPYKSGKVEEEAREAESAVKKLGGSMRETKTLVLPGTDVDRTFVPIDKINVTPKKYPRKAGMPGKEPLK
jgi:16S rRNA (guanine527-N7)-methyltransferase